MIWRAGSGHQLGRKRQGFREGKPVPVMQRFSGLAAKAARVRADLTQVELAERIGVAPGAVLRYEHGNPPNANRLAKMSEVLGFPLGYFFEDVEEVA